MSLPCRYFVVVAFGLACAIDSTVVAQPLGKRLLNRIQNTAPVESANFIVYGNDRLMAAKVSQAAEGFRKTLAAQWLGRELPNWPQKCPIRFEIAPHAGGKTEFAFVMNGSSRGVPIDWSMEVFGSPERILDAVLPHEITHTIFATHFGRPLPRWADEGACTTVEHVSERNKNHQMLLQFLTTSRGIPFNRMFTMKQYPSDILPLYAQGYSVAKYLIFQKGRKHFLNYIDRGMQYDEQGYGIAGWNRATDEFYGFEDLSDLQLSWVAWVRSGSEESTAVQAASNSQPKRPKSATTIQRPQQTYTSASPRPEPKATGHVQSLLDTDNATVAVSTNQNDSWYASQMKIDPTARAARQPQTIYVRKAITSKSQSGSSESDIQEPVAPVRDSRLTLPTDLILR